MYTRVFYLGSELSFRAFELISLLGCCICEGHLQLRSLAATAVLTRAIIAIRACEVQCFPEPASNFHVSPLSSFYHTSAAPPYSVEWSS